MIYPPQYVKQILKTLQSREHQAYLVGGCVRDMLLDIQPQDWDICTSALPEQILELFPGSKPTGIRHGTVTVIINNHQVEVTTFRTEDDYADHRHPDRVVFVSDLTSDLSRRDFTVNAMAVSSEGELVDPFDGRTDLQKKVIRCVGDPDLRFQEDALRMYRALRFAARYEFTIAEETRQSIYRNASYSDYLAVERIRDEVHKMLVSSHTEYLDELLKMKLMDRFCIPQNQAPGCGSISTLKKRAYVRWPAFCYLLKKTGWITSISAFLHHLRMDNRTTKICSLTMILLENEVPKDRIAWKRALSRYGIEAVECAALISDWQDGTNLHKELTSIVHSKECFNLRHLAVNGNDLKELGYNGPVLGEMMQFLLDYVIEHPEKNKRELLLDLAGDNEET